MKKFSLILLGVFGLLFTTNVYADCLDYAICPITIRTSPFGSIDVTNSVTYTDDNGSQTDFFTETYNYSNYNYTYSESGFGRYSDGTPIASYRFNSYNQMQWRRHTGTFTDSQGNVEVYQDIDNARRIDVIVNWAGNQLNSLVGQLSWRFDFAVHFDFYDSNNNSLNNDYTKSIFNGLYLETAYTNGVTCFAQYDTPTYMVNISCTGMLPKTFKYSFIFGTIKDKTMFYNSSADYTYKAVIGFSEATMMTSPTGRLEDLILDDSPNGSSFNDYYKKVEIQSDNYFDNFTDLNLGGLTQVVTSPLAFVRSLSSSYFDNSLSQYHCSIDPLKLNFNLFNHNVCVPSGLIFWGRLYNDSSKQALLDTFHMTWNLLFGGFIIYKLSVKLYKKCLDSFDPDSRDEVEQL